MAEKSRSAKLRVKAQVGEKRGQLESALHLHWMRKFREYGGDMAVHEFKSVCQCFIPLSHDFITDFCITTLNIPASGSVFVYLRSHALTAMKQMFRVWYGGMCARRPAYGLPGSVPEFDNAVVHMLQFVGSLDDTGLNTNML